MSYRYDNFAPGEVYHIFTRGVNSSKIFRDTSDFQRFTSLLLHCLPQGMIHSYSIARRLRQLPTLPEAGAGLVDLHCYCLMTNHVHLLVKENVEGGTSLYMQRLLNSYAKYFNTRYKRSGPLFTSRFKAVLVDSDEQLLHVSRYIHLNPYIAHLINKPLEYPWSSLRAYTSVNKEASWHTQEILELLSPEKYRLFVCDEANYARSLGDIKHLLLEEEA